MPRRNPKTKAGKQRKVKKVMGEFKRKTLRSSSGRKVTSRKQALAIAMNVSGQSKPKSKRRKSSKRKRRRK